MKTLLIALASPLLVLLAAVLLALTAPLAPVLYLTWVLAQRYRRRKLEEMRRVVEAARRAAQPPILNPSHN